MRCLPLIFWLLCELVRRRRRSGGRGCVCVQECVQRKMAQLRSMNAFSVRTKRVPHSNKRSWQSDDIRIVAIRRYPDLDRRSKLVNGVPISMTLSDQPQAVPETKPKSRSRTRVSPLRKVTLRQIALTTSRGRRRSSRRSSVYSYSRIL